MAVSPLLRVKSDDICVRVSQDRSYSDFDVSAFNLW